MKKFCLITILLLSVMSCYDGFSDMQDKLGIKVPICVNPLSTAAAPDGRGWANAFKTIQDAVDSPATEAGCEIWVAGSFTLAGGQGITISKAVSIYGGFNGTEVARDERPEGGRTVITGQADPAIEIKTQGFVLDGFSISDKPLGMGIRINDSSYSATIQNCSFSNNGASAFFINQGAIEIKNCIFSNNTISAIQASAGNSIVINDSVFTNNDVTSNSLNGAAIIGTGSCSITINNSKFTDNKAINGGAIYFTSTGRLTINICNFTNNNATDTGTVHGGGGINITSGSCVITGSTFNQNTTQGQGGGIYLATGCVSLDVTDSIFAYNTATTNCGGAIGTQSAFVNSKITIISCRFESNTAAAPGGALYLIQSATATLNIVNSLFYNNSSTSNGGAIYLNTTMKPVMTNLTFYLNKAAVGGAIYQYASADITLYNTIFYGNTLTDGTTKDNVKFQSDPFLHMRNCFFYDNTSMPASFDKYHCIENSSSPFVSTDNTSSSFLHPADAIVDQGDDTPGGEYSVPAYTVPSTDLARKTRIVDISGITNVADGTVDLGCYERQ